MDHKRAGTGRLDRDVDPSSDGRGGEAADDPLGFFAEEKALASAPSSPRQGEDGAIDLPLRAPASTDAAPHPEVDDATAATESARPWMPFAAVAAAIAAFAAGAYLYSTYPSWLRPSEPTTVVAKAPAAPLEPRAGQPATPAPNTAEANTTEANTSQRNTTKPNTSEPHATVADTAPPPSPRASSPSVRREPQAVEPSSDVSPMAADSDAKGRLLSGEWSMTTRVETSRLKRYEGLRLGYQVRLQQVGNRLRGDGYKLLENGQAVVTRTPIRLNGTVEGDRVVLTFQESGTRRPSQGKLVLDRESDDVLRGRFSSDAAQSSGLVEAHR
jgi:hypothetical protein